MQNMRGFAAFLTRRLLWNEMHALTHKHFLSAFILLNKRDIFISPHLGEAKCTYLKILKMLREESLNSLLGKFE